eukprot:633014-Prymnesium_polylepis.2
MPVVLTSGAQAAPTATPVHGKQSSRDPTLLSTIAIHLDREPIAIEVRLGRDEARVRTALRARAHLLRALGLDVEEDAHRILDRKVEEPVGQRRLRRVERGDQARAHRRWPHWLDHDLQAREGHAQPPLPRDRIVRPVFLRSMLGQDEEVARRQRIDAKAVDGEVDDGDGTQRKPQEHLRAANLFDGLARVAIGHPLVVQVALLPRGQQVLHLHPFDDALRLDPRAARIVLAGVRADAGELIGVHPAVGVVDERQRVPARGKADGQLGRVDPRRTQLGRGRNRLGRRRVRFERPLQPREEHAGVDDLILLMMVQQLAHRAAKLRER